MARTLFLSWFMHRRREMAHPMLTKGLLQLRPEAAMLPGPRVETRPPPPVPPFLLAKNLSPKNVLNSGQRFPCLAVITLNLPLKWLLLINLYELNLIVGHLRPGCLCSYLDVCHSQAF